eukprot:scaffold22542_cov19-Cyclotella_meneghiniana.AAC.1
MREQNERTRLSKLDAKDVELKQLNKQIQSFEHELSEGNALRKDHELRLQQSQDELSNLHTEMSQLQAQIQNEQDQHSRCESQLRGDIKELKSHVDRELTRSKELQSQVDSVSSDLAESKKLLAANSDEFDMTLKQQDSLVQSLSHKITELEESYKSMQLKTKKRGSLGRCLHSKIFQVQTLKEEKSTLEESLRAKQHQLVSESSSQREQILEKDSRNMKWRG